jgi:hypothetical protein
MVLTLPVTIAKYSQRRAGWHGLLAGLCIGFPIIILGLYTISKDPRTWVWFLGRPMLWAYVGLISLLVILCLWTQSAAFWFGRRKLHAALTVVGSIGILGIVWTAGFRLMRLSDERSSAALDSASNDKLDVPWPRPALTAMDGTPISTSDLPGNLTVIDFWRNMVWGVPAGTTGDRSATN